jgi:hypothetical protein
LQVLRGPPVAEIACSVELAALVVERVADLVADPKAALQALSRLEKLARPEGDCRRRRCAP